MRWRLPRKRRDSRVEYEYAHAGAPNWDPVSEDFNADPDMEFDDAPVIGRSIVNRATVCGGAPCVEGTRIPVWVLERCRQRGMTDEEILLDYPGLEYQDLLSAWDYVEENQEEIENQIVENEEW